MNIPIETIFSNLASLFILLVVGWALVKTGLLKAELTAPFNALLLNVTLPCTIFSGMMREFDPAFLKDSLLIVIVGFVLYIGVTVLALPAAKLFRVPADRKGTWMMSLTYPNVGFMGYPLILTLLGEEAMALAVMMAIPFNLLIYTLGARQTMLGTAIQNSGEKLDLKKLLFTMVNFSTLLGILFFCLQIPVPEVVLTPIKYLANVTTPLSMIVVGMNIAKGSVREVFQDVHAFTGVLMKLVIVPLIVWAVLKLCPFSNPLMSPVILLSIGMPSAAVACLLAEKYHGDAMLASHIVFLSSILCLITIPVLCLLP